MKIVVSQQNKRINVIFKKGDIADKYYIDKSDDFLLALDKFLKKHKVEIESIKKTDLTFENSGLLTERVVKAMIDGLRF